MTKVIEAVRQLRGEAHPKVQVKNCDLALAHGTGGSLGTRHGSATAHPGAGVDHGRHQGTQAAASPRISPETQPFWDAAGKGKLLVRKLHGLRQGAPLSARHLPVLLQRQRPNGSRRRARARSTPTASMRRAPVPYAIAYVTLDEGPTMLTNIVDCDLDALQVGQTVKVVFKPTDGRPAAADVHAGLTFGGGRL